MATLKQILDAMMGASGFQIPSAYATSTNPDDVQLLHLANEASDELREMGLTPLRRFHTVNLSTAADYALPGDFLALVPDTAFARTLPLNLPASSEDWAYLVATGIGGARYHARIIDGRLHILNPTPGDTIRFEYVSNAPWSGSDGAAKELATADTDVWELDRRALTGGIKWRWKKEKGLPDWEVDLRLHANYLRALRGRDRSAQTLHFGLPEDFAPEPYTNLWVR